MLASNLCACSKSGLSVAVLRISCLIAAIVASRFSQCETVSPTVNDRRAGCLNPSRCSDQSHLSLSSAIQMIIRTAWHWIITSCFLSSCRGCCPCLCWRPVLSGSSSRWFWRFTRPDSRIPQHLCTSFECVPRQSLHLSMVTCLVAVWKCVSPLWT